MNAKHRYLLTGAGFTKNFGGFLAREMWARVFNHSQIQAVPALRDAFLADTDFESVYHNLVAGETGLDKNAVVAAVLAAYRQMDNTLRGSNFVPGSPYPVNIYAVQHLVAAFAGPRDNPGYVFTLNQDLFLERHYYNGPRPVLPGVNQAPEWFSTHFNTVLDPATFVEIAQPPELERLKIDFRKHHELVYLKLHGSCNWRGRGHPTHMVLGRDKVSQIGRNYLLSWYLELFAQCLAVPESQLLAIGYGFSDPHINQVISNCVLRHGLSIRLIDPTPADELANRIRSQPHGPTILDGICAFYTVALKDLFPANQERTADWTTIEADLLGRRVG